MKKTWTWSVHVSPFAGQAPETILESCKIAGLTSIDGTYRFFKEQSETKISAFGKLFKEGGVSIETFHLPFDSADDICSFYETTRRKAVDKVIHWMETASSLGATVGIQHSSTLNYKVDIEGIDNYMKQLGKSLATLLKKGESLGFTIALENQASPGRFTSRPEHLATIWQNFGHPNLGFCLDTGHALLALGPEKAHDFLEVMAPHMVAFHLADNAGDRDSHLAPGHGLVDWDPVFRKAAEIEFSRPMTIETQPFAPKVSAETYKQMVADTEALAQKALGA